LGVPLQTKEKVMSNLCPKCLKDDQVQKVSAIVTSGTYSTTYQMPAQGEIAGHKIYGTVQESGTGQTLLAQQLSIDYLSDKELKRQWQKRVEGLWQNLTKTSRITIQNLKIHPHWAVSNL
jgi:hypothetical protein